MRLIATILAMSLGLAVAYGQTEELRGVVLDKDDHSPIAGAIVQMQDASGHTFRYSLTNDKGEFCIQCNPAVADRLSFRCMSYKAEEVEIRAARSPMTVYLLAQPTRLRDVIVKAPDIEQRSDTLTYHMSKYAKAEDKKIADVLKRLPGIKVEENGQIKYNGEPINKFYIDGSDFMDGRYGIATENIHPSDVASVEVLENHQPIQVLKGLEFSQQAGLNIKLKEKARHRWIGILSGSLGAAPLLYDASAFAMRIAGRWQNMESARVNNTGWNPASQSTRHIDERIFGNGYADRLWDDYISAGGVQSPIDEGRTRDNFSTLANTNNSWHLGDGKDMRFHLSYEGDRLDCLAGYETDYFDEEIPSFVEHNVMRTQTHRVSGQWALQINRPAMFLKDNLYMDAGWNRAESRIGGTLSLFQKSETPSYCVTNDMQLVKRIGDNLLTVSSRNRFAYKPHSLGVTSDYVAEQEIESGDFRSVTEARYGWLLGKWNIYARGGVDFNRHDMEANLQGLTLPNSVQNDRDFTQQSNTGFTLLNTYMSPEVSYKSYKWLATLSVPASYHLHRIRDRRNGTAVSNNYVSIIPSINVRHRFSAKMDIAAQFRYSLTPPEASLYIPGILMTDFRDLYRPEPSTGYRESHSVMLNLRYRNPVTSLFFNLTGTYEWNHAPYMSSQLFIGNYILNTYESADSDGKNLSLNGSISKGLMSGRMTVGADIGYVQVWNRSMRQGEITPNVLRILFVQPTLKGYLTGWLSVDYRVAYSKNTMDIESSGRSGYDALKQFLTCTFVPHKKWQITLGGEHYRTKFNSGRSSSLVLLDAFIRWSASRRIDISLNANNLLDQREYRYASYGTLSQTEYMYRLRGRNVWGGVQVRL